VKRGRFCSRCGFPQPRRIGQALLGAATFAALTVVTARAFLSVEGGASEFKPPEPSEGKWNADEGVDEGAVRLNEPSIFMLSTQESSTETDPASAN
jgi:hypothetical protein